MWGFPCHCGLNFQQRSRIAVFPFEVLHIWKHVGRVYCHSPWEVRIPFVSFVFLQSLAPDSSSESPERQKDGCMVHLRVTTAVWNKERSVQAPSTVYMGAPAGWPNLCSFVLIPSIVSLSSAQDTFSQTCSPLTPLLPLQTSCLDSGDRISLGHQSVDSYPHS